MKRRWLVYLALIMCLGFSGCESEKNVDQDIHTEEVEDSEESLLETFTKNITEDELSEGEDSEQKKDDIKKQKEDQKVAMQEKCALCEEEKLCRLYKLTLDDKKEYDYICADCSRIVEFGAVRIGGISELSDEEITAYVWCAVCLKESRFHNYRLTLGDKTEDGHLCDDCYDDTRVGAQALGATLVCVDNKDVQFTTCSSCLEKKPCHLYSIKVDGKTEENIICAKCCVRIEQETNTADGTFRFIK